MIKFNITLAYFTYVIKLLDNIYFIESSIKYDIFIFSSLNNTSLDIKIIGIIINSSYK